MSSVFSLSSWGPSIRIIDVQGEAKERHQEGEQERVECSGGVLATAKGTHSPLAVARAGDNLTPPTPDRTGKMVSRRPRGEGLPLVIDMEEVRKAVTDFLVVRRLLSPFRPILGPCR